MMVEWVDKYKPQKWDEVLSNKTNRTIIQNFFWAWENGAPFSNALLLAGEEGCGKTTVVEVAAKEHDMTLISMNASEIRKSDVYQSLKVTSTMQSWDKDSKAIFIDECDGLGSRMDGRFGGKGNVDKSAWGQIQSMINAGRVPVILCCNYASQVPWKIRNNKNLTTLEMTSKEIPNQQIFDRLMMIATKEQYTPNIKGVKKIVEKCPTVRSCIKTLQLCCINDNWKAIYPRDVDGSLDSQMLALFKGQAKTLPNVDTYRIGNYALANNIGLEKISKFNRLSMMRRKVGGFNFHNDYALTFKNEELNELHKPQNAFKQSRIALEKRRKKEESKKRKAAIKKIQKSKLEDKADKKSKKPKKVKAPTTVPEAGWEDLF